VNESTVTPMFGIRRESALRTWIVIVCGWAIAWLVGNVALTTWTANVPDGSSASCRLPPQPEATAPSPRAATTVPVVRRVGAVTARRTYHTPGGASCGLPWPEAVAYSYSKGARG
jgi:hypothetical protein